MTKRESIVSCMKIADQDGSEIRIQGEGAAQEMGLLMSNSLALSTRPGRKEGSTIVGENLAPHQQKNTTRCRRYRHEDSCPAIERKGKRASKRGRT